MIKLFDQIQMLNNIDKEVKCVSLKNAKLK